MFYKLTQIQNTNKSIQLVSSKQAPFIISAIMEIFGSEGETPYQRFKSELDLIIKRHDRKDLATSLINEWLRQGWIRESEDVIYSTETFNLAKNFYLASLNPVVDTNASRLTFFANMVEEFSFNLTADPEVQIKSLEEDIKQKQKQIQDIKSGVFINLTEDQKSEIINEIGKVASELTSSFDILEGEVADFYQSIKETAIATTPSAGQLLNLIHLGEEKLKGTLAGSAFERFFVLFSRSNQMKNLSEQLNVIINEAGQYLTKEKVYILENIVSILNKKSSKVLDLRRRFVSDLKNFVQAGQYENIKGIGREISIVKQLLLDLKKKDDLSLYKEGLFELDIGGVKPASPMKVKIELPEERIEIVPIEQESLDIVPDFFQHKETKAERVERIKKFIVENSHLTLGEICSQLDIDGIDVIQYYLIAKELGMSEDGTEAFSLKNDSRELQISNFPRIILKDEK